MVTGTFVGHGVEVFMGEVILKISKNFLENDIQIFSSLVGG
jgi:hypothetical protein